MNNRTHKKLTAGLGITIGLLLTAGVAEAAWTTTGSGSAGAKAASSQDLVVTAGTSPAADVYPGTSTGSLVVTISNPNLFPVQLSSIAAGAVSGITSTGANCAGATTGLTYNWSSKSVNQVIAAKAGSVNGTFTFTLTGALTMSNGSDPTCAGATFTIPVTVSGVSAAGSAITSPSTATVAVP